jgi:Tol biopolymer transport system component
MEAFVMKVDGSERRKLVGVDRSDEVWPRDADWPSWSPLNVIAFVRTAYEVVWEIHLVNADGSAPRHLVDGPGSSRPAWSPDGSTLAFAAWDGIRTVRADGSGSRMRVRGEDLFSPDWTPDGGFVLSTFTAPGRTRVFVAKSGGIRQLVPDVEAPAQPDYDDHSPVWARR